MKHKNTLGLLCLILVVLTLSKEFTTTNPMLITCTCSSSLNLPTKQPTKGVLLKSHRLRHTVHICLGMIGMIGIFTAFLWLFYMRKNLVACPSFFVKINQQEALSLLPEQLPSTVCLNINDEVTCGKYGKASLMQIISFIRHLAKCKEVKCLILRIGFTKQELPFLGVPLNIIKALQYLKEQTPQKEIIAYADNYLEARGYLVASWADKIYVNNAKTALYLPWAYIFPRFNAAALQQVNDKLDESSLQSKPVVAQNKEAIFAGKYKTEHPAEDLFAHLNHTIRTLQKKTRERDFVFSVSYLYTTFSQTLGTCLSNQSIYDFCYPLTHYQSRAYNLIDEKPKNLPAKLPLPYTFTHLELQQNLLPGQVDIPSIDVVYLTGGICAEQTMRLRPLLHILWKDPAVKGLLVVVSSEGGEQDACLQLVNCLKKIREAKPIVIYAQDFCCSAGYHLASLGHWIVAQTTTIIGSIGVKAEGIGQHDGGIYALLLKKHIEASYAQFVDDVATYRHAAANMEKEAYRKIAIQTQARTFTAPAALKKILIDQIGDFEDALRQLQARIGQDVPCQVMHHEWKPAFYQGPF